MAGIGFKIQKILQKGSVTSFLEAYAFAGFISAGPWIVSIVTLATLGYVVNDLLAVSRKEYDLFFITVTHVFAFALITTGSLQLIISRYIADRFYEKDYSTVFTAFMTCMILTLALSAALGIVLFGIFGYGSLIHRLGAILFYVVLSGIWIATSFVSALKNYALIVCSFAFGYFLAFCFTLVAGYFAPDYLIWGFAIGQMFLLGFLMYFIARENGRPFQVNFEWISYFKKFHYLAICGLLYYLGMWVDKFLHWWFSDGSVHIGGILFSSPIYDVAVYMAFLSLAPGMAVFLIKLETDFALRMEEYTYGIENKYTLKQLHNINQKAIIAINQGIALQVKLQVLITTLLLLYADYILSSVGISSVQTGIFRMVLIGAFLVVIFLSLFTCMFYLNRIKEACICTAIFFVLNLLFTSLEIYLGSAWYGTGFTVSAAVATVVVSVYLNKSIRNFTFRIFTEQEF